MCLSLIISSFDGRHELGAKLSVAYERTSIRLEPVKLFSFLAHTFFLTMASDYTLLCRKAFLRGKEGCNCRGGILSNIFQYHAPSKNSINNLLYILSFMQLCKSYLDICKLILIPPVGNTELSSMCRVLADQVS